MAEYCDRDGCGANGCQSKLRHNLRRYWKQHLLHVSIGALGGALMMTADGDIGQAFAGFAVFLAQHIRQLGGFWQKADTLSIDLLYCQGGLISGILGVLGAALAVILL